MRRVLVSVALVVTFVVVPAGSAQAWVDKYVALGDSYSSGTGTRSYYEGCERSYYAYPHLLRWNWPRKSDGVQLWNLTCGGATLSDVLYKQIPQIPNYATHVSITIGGNDARFGDVIKQCANLWPTTCWGDINKAEDYIRNILPYRLRTVYSSIRRAAPMAHVMVVGYPRIFQVKKCGGAAGISTGEQKRLNETAQILAAVTHWMTASAGRAFYFIDSDPAFAGHRVCSSDEWINGVSNPFKESFHPDRDGHRRAFHPLLAWTIASAG